MIKMVTIADVCEVIAGQSPPSNTYNQNGDGIPFFQGKADFNDLYPTVRYWCNKPKKIAEVGDVLISVRAPVGPTNMCNTRACIGRGLSAIRASKEVDKKYLLYYLRSYETRLSSKGVGSTFSSITQKEIKSIPLPLPPLEDQKRIVAILDQADSLRKKRKEAMGLLDEYVQSVFLDMFGDPVANPKGWNVVKFGDVISLIKYGSSAKSDMHPSEGSLPILRIPNVSKGCINYNDLQFQTLSQKEQINMLVEKGDLLFVRSNGNPDYIGKCAVFEDDKKFLFASYLIKAKLKLDSEMNPFFVTHCFSFPTYRSKIRQESRTTAGNYNINTKGIKNFDLISPPKDLQDQFIEIVKQKNALLDKMNQQSIEMENQFNSLTQKAFTGAL